MHTGTAKTSRAMVARSGVVGVASVTVNPGVGSIRNIAIVRTVVGRPARFYGVVGTAGERIGAITGGIVVAAVTVDAGVGRVGDVAVMRTVVGGLGRVVVVGVICSIALGVPVVTVVGESTLDFMDDIRHDECVDGRQ